MVRGFELFRRHFADHEDRYVLIGGTAVAALLEDAGLQARATKDLDIVLCLEALDPAFVAALWQFIEMGQYTLRERATGKRELYRFQKPADQSYPEMLELFSRRPEMIILADGQHLTPIPADGEIDSLSAILLDDDYYAFLHARKLMVQGVPMVDAAGLIGLKTYAWVQLTADRDAGKQVDSKNINKHRGDVFRLFALVSPEMRIEAPQRVRENVARFLDALDGGLDLAPFGLKGMHAADAMSGLRSLYGI